MNAQNQSPLRWPQGWVRTNIRDRKTNAAWKKSLRDATDALLKEIGKMTIGEVAVGDITISYNVDPAESRRDPGVAVYFSKFRKPDYSWMDSLGLDGVPTIDQIESAYKEKAFACHPDRFPNDPAKGEMFIRLGRDKKRGIDWIKGTDKSQHDYEIACDQYEEVRLNVMGLRGAIAAIRTLQRVGVPGLMERVVAGFKTALPPEGGTSEPKAS